MPIVSARTTHEIIRVTTMCRSPSLRRVLPHLLLLFAVTIFSIPNISAACGLIETVPGSVHRISQYLRIYPAESQAQANSLLPEDILLGVTGGNNYVYATDAVSSDDTPLPIVIPLWVDSSRLDIANGTSGNAAALCHAGISLPIPKCLVNPMPADC